MTSRFLRLLFAAALLAALGACHRQEVIVYTAPKDAAEAPEAPDAAPEEQAPAGQVGTNAPPPPKRADFPRVTWKLPAGWTETGPGEMSVAGFSIESGGATAAVQITPMASMAGQEAQIVNMWRQRLGETKLPEAEALAAFTPVEVAGGTGKIFELGSQRAGKAIRIVSAMFDRGESSWFFKLQGDAAAVEAQKPAFLEFLKTIKFEEQAVAAITDPPPPPEAAPDQPAFEAPEGWRKRPAGQMQVAKFAVPLQGDASADVSVSVFPSDTGGPVLNITRWRRQLGMPEIPEAEVKASIKPLEGVEGAVFADFRHEQRALIGAIVPRDGQWYFFKLMGDEPAVSAARETFLNFARTQPKS